MAIRIPIFVAIGVLVTLVSSAAIDNSVYDVTPRIHSGDELISKIISHCFKANTMNCLSSKVLTYLDTIAGVTEESVRAFKEENIDNAIFERVGRILSTNEIRLELPETVFQHATVSYRPDRGLDFELSTDNEARGLLLKKKLLLPVLLLLKLKMKALMPIFVALIGLKAVKALILSKIAIKLVLGFLIYQLIQKLGGMKMSMMPMAPPEPPMSAYGAPSPTTPASSYEPSWEPSGGPYSRVWEPSNGPSSQSLAYSAYYPSSSSSAGSSGTGSSSLLSSSSSLTAGSASSPTSSSYSYTS